MESPAGSESQAQSPVNQEQCLSHWAEELVPVGTAAPTIPPTAPVDPVPPVGPPATGHSCCNPGQKTGS